MRKLRRNSLILVYGALNYHRRSISHSEKFFFVHVLMLYCISVVYWKNEIHNVCLKCSQDIPFCIFSTWKKSRTVFAVYSWKRYYSLMRQLSRNTKVWGGERIIIMLQKIPIYTETFSSSVFYKYLMQLYRNFSISVFTFFEKRITQRSGSDISKYKKITYGRRNFQFCSV